MSSGVRTDPSLTIYNLSARAAPRCGTEMVVWVCYDMGVRKIVVLAFVSLDGVMQAPGGPEEDTSEGFQYGGWTAPYADEFSGNVMREQMGVPFDLLLGRK